MGWSLEILHLTKPENLNPLRQEWSGSPLDGNGCVLSFVLVNVLSSLGSIETLAHNWAAKRKTEKGLQPEDDLWLQSTARKQTNEGKGNGRVTEYDETYKHWMKEGDGGGDSEANAHLQHKDTTVAVVLLLRNALRWWDNAPSVNDRTYRPFIKGMMIFCQ